MSATDRAKATGKAELPKGSTANTKTPGLSMPPLDPLRRDAGYRLLSEAIKALTIVNGGAAVAALAFLGQLSQRFPLTSVMLRDAAFALAALAIGTMLPPLAALAFAYNSLRPRKHLVLIGRWAILLSTVTFFLGLYFGWKVLEPLGFFNIEVKR